MLVKYTRIAMVIALTNLSTILATYIYVTAGLRQEVFIELNKLKEEVTITNSLRNNEEVRMSVVEAIKNLSAKSGSKLNIEQIVEVTEVIMEKYKLHGIKPSLAISIITNESSFDPKAMSPANAKGLMQVMDSTARPYLANYGVAWNTEVLFDPVVNTRVALDYLQNLHEIHVAEGLEQNDDYTVSLLRYNRSQQATDKLLEDPLGLQYTARINQTQTEIRKGGVI